MYRVKTTYRNGTDRPIIEYGPWHDSRKNAEHWAELLGAAGYVTSIETQNVGSNMGDDNSDLAAALAGMA
jgi:hypothetical protein